MGESAEERSGAEYLAQLLKDKKQIQAFPNVFIHLERLLDDEINKVRVTLFNLEKKPLALPDEDGQPKVTLTEKLFVPVKEHPDFNFVGRILGPRGITAKQLERDTGCKIMVRGKGSMRDRKKEDQMKGKPNWEHLSEELHVLVVVEDTQKRAEVKMSRAVDEIRRLLIPAPEGEDELKRRQLMELAIINGTYRDTKTGQPGPNTQSCVSPAGSISPALPGAVVPNGPAALAAAVANQIQSRLMGQPIMPSGQFPGLNIAALQNPLLRAQLPGGIQGSLPGAPGAGQQYLLQPRLPGVTATSQPPALMRAMAPSLVTENDNTQSQSNAMLYTQALQGGTTMAGQGNTDYGQHYGLVSPTLLDYQSLDPSAAGAIPKVRRAPVTATAGHPYQRV